MAQREQEGDDADGDVDEEDPRPGEEVDEDAAEQQPDRAATDRDRSPDTHRLRPLGPFGEGCRDDRERGGRDQRGAEALQPARDDKELRRGRQPADQRTGGEDDDAGEEDALAAHEVARAAAQQKESPEDERVRVHDPLQVGVGHLEVGLDRRQRDVHDRRIEDDHELRQADEDQDEPRVLVRRHTSTLPVPLKAPRYGKPHHWPTPTERLLIYEWDMADAEIHTSIEELVAEEHSLWEREAAGVATDHDRRRLEAVKVSLDQCWDLLRQRRARREAGQDPDAAELRPPQVVERYEQ